MPSQCPICSLFDPWEMGEAQIGRLTHSITVWAEVTRCKRCGFYLMSDEQIELADQQLSAVENTYSRS